VTFDMLGVYVPVADVVADRGDDEAAGLPGLDVRSEDPSVDFAFDEVAGADAFEFHGSSFGA